MPRGSGPLTRALVVAAVVCTAVTACTATAPTTNRSGSAAPTMSEPTSPSTGEPSVSSSGSPTPPATAVADPTLGPLPDGVAPARPAALDQPPTLEGAKAVATYFLLLYPYAYQTGDLSAWNTLAHPDCNFCASVRTHVSQASSAGRHTVGGAFTITAVKGTEVNPGKFFDIQLTNQGAMSQVVIAAGAVVKNQPAGRYETDIVVLFEDGTWRVRGVEPKQAE